MSKSLFVAGLVWLVPLSTASAAGISPLKAGTWDVGPITGTLDGRDMRSTMLSVLALLAPERGKPGVIRVCVSPETAESGLPPRASEAGCAPLRMKRTGKTVTFSFACARDGQTTAGKGEAREIGSRLHISVSASSTGPTGAHSGHGETDARFLGPGCRAGAIDPSALGW